MNQSEEGNRYEMERADESNKKQEQRIRKQEAKAVQNLNLYFIFQAIILGSSSVANPGSSCHNWWIPIALSLLAAVANLVSLWAEMWKILKWREEVDQSTSDLAFMKVHRLSREQVKQVVAGGAFRHQGGEIVRPKAEMKWKRRLVASLSMGLFATFSAVVMYGCHRVLCHPKCVNLC